jgi:energy-coupling factor transporter ATP-binding protein EcfA2
LTLPVGLFIFVVTEGRDGPFLTFPDDSVQKKTNNPYQEELEQRVKEKLDQELFNVTLRLYVKGNNPQETNRIAKGFISVISSYGNSGYQSLIAKKILSVPKIPELLNWTFSKRLSLFPGSVILSTSEVADLYHFPYTSTTKTENIVKLMSRELPTPLSLKNDDNLDVVFGKNTYGGSEVDIGLTDDDRSRHLYLIGQTGSGKSTVIFHMASDDIKKGSGVAVIDPHGDLAEDLLSVVPLVRMNDLIYFNPFDIKYPIGINLLELVPGLDEDAVEQEKELVCESVVSVFRKIFSKDESTDAHRIEYILRNTIYTAFSVPDATIFTVYDLLENPDFQKQVIKNLEDENLKNFWKNEFGRAGNYQIVKMVSGVTAKIGRFLFSPTAKRILEQPHSTINFDEILDRKKILICNLAEGKLGEDTSRLLGTMIIAKIQQAVLRRARIQKDQRQPFYLFIDEFQNYATSSFSKLLSGGRKFGLRFTIAEQSTAQQEDRNITNVILANTGTIICFRTASPIDEELMLNQFAPYVNKSDIINLPRFKFYIKLSALTPEEPFSGETLPIVIKKDQTKTDKLIEASRKNYATLYQKPKIKKPVTEVKKDGVKGDIKKKADVDSLT